MQRNQKEGQALSVRLWLNCLATQELLCTYLGIRLGLYDALTQGAANAAQLAARAHIAVRYAREWLEQQAVAGILTVERNSANGNERVYSLSDAHREVLTDSDSPFSRVAGIRPLGAVAQALPELLAAYRSGAGVADRAYGQDWMQGHGGSNRALYAHYLANWIRTTMPDVDARLSAEGARAADIGCGAGWAVVALALAYPKLHAEGFDIDREVLREATRNAEQSGVAERVHFQLRDCSLPGIEDNYDLVCLFDTLHELPKPVEVLRNCRAACAAEGCVLVIDANVAEEFVAPANEIERFQYTTSVLHCLPASMVEQPSAETGTIMRPALVRRYVQQAGFADIKILPTDDRFHRLYRVCR
jgi:2-polyprenyl-3-methyl-5-hydroxy-6-metoxy-1,4-benzoquinol methylase